MPLERAFLLDPELAAFLTSGVSISVGSRSIDRVPNLAPGIGCRVAADRSRVSLFVVAAQSRELLDDLRATGAVAAVFSEPRTYRAVQLKGEDAAVEALAAGDARVLDRYRNAFADELGALGHAAQFARTLVERGIGDVVAVTFAPTGAFVQTPGPNAGTRLGAAR